MPTCPAGVLGPAVSETRLLGPKHPREPLPHEDERSRRRGYLLRFRILSGGYIFLPFSVFKDASPDAFFFCILKLAGWQAGTMLEPLCNVCYVLSRAR